jgi:hypothetical protein
MKPTDALNSNFNDIATLHVSGSLSAHHQEQDGTEFHPASGSKRFITTA